ncbi:uncharacterized protein Eint_090100 [Encephalitozoon intestinalis ATCC 50506]|uniref:Uncharacterized protein n=1 Tax=Encephalitozoon intestinalis (strain ATCC 50506) TaxID=876142 RepID=E0S923_ENCIT|nr:uncharacterized protein Eint_090100 [Encephalitozoon intestinalis ATCC 50506]ADM12140.1 hypothetical protein Eint_090100 [Encephalitozoon intestinalis ATCC 50506]UTX45941.1 hypothetical protein GPK93_09g15260 [Encephalitozoon intestinalis]
MGLSFPSGDVGSLYSSLRRRIEQKKRQGAMYKDFIRKIYDLEDELDFISSEEQKNMVEGTKRRRRSTTLDVDEILYITGDEIAKDLRRILEGEDLDVFVENNTLNVKGSMFTKGDKIKATINGDEFVGTIISMSEEDIVLKTKHYKRLRILLEDMRLAKSSIVAIGRTNH